jgi:hypothetical protein
MLRYASNPVVYFVNSTIAPNVPSKAGGAVSTWMVKPALPRGLVFNDTDGETLPRRPKCIDWDGVLTALQDRSRALLWSPARAVRTLSWPQTRAALPRRISSSP